MNEPRPDDDGDELAAPSNPLDDDPFADLDAEIDARLAASGPFADEPLGGAAGNAAGKGTAGGVTGRGGGGAAGGGGGGGVGDRPIVTPRANVEPLPLEADSATPGSPRRTAADDDDEVPLAQRSVKELDTCPNCGGSMRGGDQIVCMRCGFDLNSMKVISTATAATAPSAKPKHGKAAAEAEDEPAPREPLTTPGIGDFWLPGAIAAVGAIVLIIAYLAGAVAVFPALEEAALTTETALEIGFMQRVQGLGQEAILWGIWWMCGIGALLILTAVLGMRLGDGVLASMRMLGIVAAMRVTTLIGFANNAAEFIVEAVLSLAIFAGLSIALFRLKPRDAAWLTAGGLGSYLILWVVARLVVMAT